ncbi:Ig-like protein group 2, partial [Anaerobacterium chartisolvens]
IIINSLPAGEERDALQREVNIGQANVNIAHIGLLVQNITTIGEVNNIQSIIDQTIVLINGLPEEARGPLLEKVNIGQINVNIAHIGLLVQNITTIGEVNNIQSIIDQTIVLINGLPEYARGPLLEKVYIGQINVNIAHIGMLVQNITTIGEINNIQSIIDQTIVLINGLPESDRGPLLEKVNIGQINVNIAHIGLLVQNITTIGEINNIQSIIDQTIVLINGLPEGVRGPLLEKVNIGQINVNIAHIGLLVQNITTIGEINNIQSIIDQTIVLINGLPEGVRGPLLEKVNIGQINVNIAHIGLLVQNITTIGEVNNIQSIIDQTIVLINGLHEDARGPLLEKVNIGQINVNIAHIGLLVQNITTIGEVNNIQSIIDQTIVLINELPEGVRGPLLEKVSIGQINVNIAHIGLLVQNITTIGEVNNIQSIIDQTIVLINGLHEDARGPLLEKVNIGQINVNIAHIGLLVQNITTIGEINNIQSIIDQTIVLINGLPEGVRGPLLEKVNIGQINVNIAHIGLLVQNITTIGEVNNIQSIIDQTIVLINGLPESDRGPLLEKVNIGQINVNIAHIGLLVQNITTIGEINNIQSIIDQTIVLINGLPEGVRGQLLEKVNIGQINVNIAHIGLLVQNITTIGEVNNIQSIIDSTIVLINALPESDRGPLLEKVNIGQINVNIAHIGLLVQNITTIGEINNIQSIIDRTIVLINGLPEPDRGPLLEKVKIGQINVNIAHIGLLVQNITTIGEVNNIQSIIDQTIVLINALPEGETKAALKTKLEILQAKVMVAYAGFKVKMLEEMSLDLTTKEKVENTQAFLNEVRDLVEQLLEGNEKSLLIKRIDEVQSKINIAIVEEPVIGVDIEGPTNSDVTVTIDNWGNAAIKHYRIDNGEWKEYLSPIIMQQNGLVEAQSISATGYLSGIVSIRIDNIDKIPPPIPVITPNTTAPTSVSVTIDITNWGDAQIKKYRVDGGGWKEYTSPVVIMDNGLIEAVGVDAAGNSSGIGTLRIDNINKTPASIKINEPDEKIFRVGAKLQLAVTATFENGNVIFPYEQITWKSSNSSIAKVDQNGVVTALKSGTVTIYASDSKNNKLTSSISLRISQLISLYMDVDKSNLRSGETASAKVYGIFLSGNYIFYEEYNDVIWSSSHPEIIQIDQNGLIKVRNYNKSYSTYVTVKAVDRHNSSIYCTKQVSVRK